MTGQIERRVNPITNAIRITGQTVAAWAAEGDADGPFNINTVRRRILDGVPMDGPESKRIEKKIEATMIAAAEVMSCANPDAAAKLIRKA